MKNIILIILALTILHSCKNTKNEEQTSKKDLEIKERELALKEKDMKLKEEEMMRKREGDIQRKEEEFRQKQTTGIALNGKYTGSIRDGTYWEVFITDFDGSNFKGYNIIYWDKHPEGMVTNFSGEFKLSDNMIVMYEDRNAERSGAFYGTVTRDGDFMNGSWYRYSDRREYIWNLKKTD